MFVESAEQVLSSSGGLEWCSVWAETERVITASFNLCSHAMCVGVINGQAQTERGFSYRTQLQNLGS